MASLSLYIQTKNIIPVIILKLFKEVAFTIYPGIQSLLFKLLIAEFTIVYIIMCIYTVHRL